MAKANLPPIKIPATLLGDSSERAYFEAINFAIYQLFQRSGGGGDNFEQILIDIAANSANIVINAAGIAVNVTNIATNTTNISTNTANIATNAADIDDIENGVPEPQLNPSDFQGSFYESVQNSSYQTFSNEIIKLSADVTITLNPYPKDSERVYIKSATGKGFTVSATRKIDGNTSIRFNNPYSGYWFSYSIELDTWSIL